jgi:hypothetical protein
VTYCRSTLKSGSPVKCRHKPKIISTDIITLDLFCKKTAISHWNQQFQFSFLRADFSNARVVAEPVISLNYSGVLIECPKSSWNLPFSGCQYMTEKPHFRTYVLKITATRWPPFILDHSTSNASLLRVICSCSITVIG